MKEILPINPHRHARKTLWQEFWTDFLGIFIHVDDPVGAVCSVIAAVYFILNWCFYCFGRFILRMKLSKPKAKKK